MADDRTPQSTTEPEAEPETVEDVQVNDEERDNRASTSSDTGRNSDQNHGEEEGSSGYFSRMMQKKIGGGDLERRIELIDKEEESLESRMIIRERTAEQVNRSMIFLSLNLEFVAGIYAYLRIRSRNLSWRGRAIRILPMFLVPALASFFCSLFSRFTSMLNLRDRRLLERLRKEREAKMHELKERAYNYMAKRHIQDCNGESSSMASSWGTNLPEVSDTKYRTVHPILSRSKSKLHPDISTYHDAWKPIVHDENGKKKLKNLLICSTCRMHNGFSSRDELPFISYKCPHCNSLNGPHKEKNGCDSASTSGEGAPQSHPFNPFSIREMPRGISIEEITPNHETGDPEMDAPVMIIRESPIIGGMEELPSACSPDRMTSATAQRLPIGLSIEEMDSNEEKTNAEMEPPVLNIPEPPYVVPSPMVPELARGLSVEEISPSNQQVEQHEAMTPIVFLQESPVTGGQAELPSSQNSAIVALVTVPEMPTGISIEEMTPTQVMAHPEMEPPVMIIRESPSAGTCIMGNSSFITPLSVQEMTSGLSIEEVSSNHQFTEDHETEPPVMFVQLPPSLDRRKLSVRIPHPSVVNSVSVPETPGFFVEELSPNQQGNEDSQMESPVVIIQDSPSRGVPATVTPLEIPELSDNITNLDDSANWSTPGSSAVTESSVTFQTLSELDQDEINANDVSGSSDNESLEKYLHGDADAHGPIKAAVTSQTSLTRPDLTSENESVTDDSTGGNYETDSNSWRSFGSGSVSRRGVTVTESHPGTSEKSPSNSQQMDVHKMNVIHPDTDLSSPYSENETDSDYGSFTDVNEQESTLDLENRVEAGGAVAGSSVRVLEQNSRNAEEQNELFTSTYDDNMDSYGDFRSSSRTSGVTGSCTVSKDKEQWGDWQQSEKNVSGPISGQKNSDGLNLTTTGATPVEETHLSVGEMPPTNTREEAEELEEWQQDGPRSSVSGNSDTAEESLAGSEDYTSHDDPNHVGSVAYDRDKGSASQHFRKGVGSMKTVSIIQDKKRLEGEIVKEVSDKEGSLKKQEIKPKPTVKVSTALLTPNSGLDPQSRPVMGIVNNPAPQWGTSTDFDIEPPRAVGLRHRR